MSSHATKSSSASALTEPSAGAGAAAATSKRLTHLTKAHETALKNFTQLLTGSVSADNFKRAFPTAGERYPAALAANADPATRGVLAFAMEAEFGALTRAAPETIPLLVTDVVRNFTTLARAEFNVLMRELGLPDQFVELERREEALRSASGDASADRPAPLTLRPEDEMRSVAVESKLAYEQQLSKELERVRRLAARECVQRELRCGRRLTALPVFFP